MVAVIRSLLGKPRNHVAVFRLSALNCRDQVRIQAELQDHAALSLAREFRVDHLVKPAPQIAWCLNALEHIVRPT